MFSWHFRVESGWCTQKVGSKEEKVNQHEFLYMETIAIWLGKRLNQQRERDDSGIFSAITGRHVNTEKLAVYFGLYDFTSPTTFITTTRYYAAPKKSQTFYVWTFTCTCSHFSSISF